MKILDTFGEGLNKRLFVYCKGGLGDLYPMACALNRYTKENKIIDLNINFALDSHYFSGNFPRNFGKYEMDLLNKISPNVGIFPPWVGNNANFAIQVDDEFFERKNVNQFFNEFMFWRPETTKQIISNSANQGNTIFIDNVYTECILVWNNNISRYERMSEDREPIKFTPSNVEKTIIDNMLKNKHVLIHVKDKGETLTVENFKEIITFCNKKEIVPILIGNENVDNFSDMKVFNLMGDNVLSFDGMGYLITQSKLMLGNDSGFSTIKHYENNPDKNLIVVYPGTTIGRKDSMFFAHEGLKKQNNYLLLDGREEGNVVKIKDYISKIYENKKNRLIFYVSLGLGDWYYTACTIPAICKKYNIEKEDVHAYVDSIHFCDTKFVKEKESAEKMLSKVILKENIHYVPYEQGSWRGVTWSDEEYEIKYGPKYETIKNEFLFYRNEETKNYMKNILKESDIFIHGIMSEFIYEWKNGENILINDLEKRPMKFELTKEQKEKCDKLLSGKSLLIHVRQKSSFENSKHYNKILSYCNEKNIKCILIGLKDRTFAGSYGKIKLQEYKNVYDLRNELSFKEIWYLLEHSKHMLTSSSLFTLHRVLFNEKTIICSPHSFGHTNSIYSKEALKNNNFIFLDSEDKNITDDIIKKINEWEI